MALDAEGVAPAKRYYEEFGVTFPSLVDPNYATKFGAVPKTFFVDEHGVVLDARASGSWRERLSSLPNPRPVTEQIRSQWSDPMSRLRDSAVNELIARHAQNPRDLSIAAELGSRYLSLGEASKAEAVLSRAASAWDPREVVGSDNVASQQLARVYFQWSRVTTDDREKQVARARQSFFLSPSIGFGKQIARIIAPAKFDGRPAGDFDNAFREGTLRRLKEERRLWLQADPTD